jgi:hypothetical protein
MTIAGNCFGLIILSLKFSEKVSEPGGHGLLDGILCAEAPSDGIPNIAR